MKNYINKFVFAGDTAKTGVFIAVAVVAILLIIVLMLTSKKKGSDEKDKKDRKDADMLARDKDDNSDE